jgi:putative transposase
MPTYVRARVPGASFFFTVALADRRSSALVEDVAHLRGAVAEVRRKRPFQIEAMVILPDHLHAVWTLPEGDSDFPLRWKEIKAEFTMRTGRSGPRSASKIAKGEKGLWQRRFWEHLIRDETDFRQHVEYCWGNPVKHGLVIRAVDWPFSSIHRDIRAGRVPPEWSGSCSDGSFGE